MSLKQFARQPEYTENSGKTPKKHRKYSKAWKFWKYGIGEKYKIHIRALIILYFREKKVQSILIGKHNKLSLRFALIRNVKKEVFSI